MRMTVEVQYANAFAGVPQAQSLERTVDVALRATDRQDFDVCVRLVDEEDSAALNAQYRGKDKPTNVLSFPADIPIPQLRVLGDVVICVPVVASEAQEQGKQLDDHYAHMVVHGVLHLCGFDHENDTDAKNMEALEVRVLAELGVEDPYQ